MNGYTKTENWSRVCVVATYAELDALEFPFAQDLHIEYDVNILSNLHLHNFVSIFRNTLQFQQKHGMLHACSSLKSFDIPSHTTKKHLKILYLKSQL